MIYIIGFIIFLVSASYFFFLSKIPPKNLLAGASLGVSFLSMTMVSVVTVGENEVGTLNRIYMAKNLPEGRVIALEGEKGPQADILGPGFHFIPFVNFLYDVDKKPVTIVKEGQYGLLVARDGAKLGDDSFMAYHWAEEKEEDMLDASYFLQNGGQKGPQFNVLKPGVYRLNPYLFDVQMNPITDVQTGHVAVVRSNVKTANIDCPDPTIVKSKGNGAVALPLVPEGCVGVWDRPLPSGRYYLNHKAFVTTEIPTRLQTWNYKGGYTERKINLTVGDDGKITQSEPVKKEIPVPADAADRAINVRVEGWTVPVEVRVVVAVNPANAPIVVASVGGLKEVEDNIITPTIRDVLRTIGGQEGRKVNDFISKRDEIVQAIEKVVIPEAAKAGVTIQEVRLGEPAIPPELLVANLRQQLATQLKATYVEEQKAQEERIQVEKTRAEADQQETLVKAQLRDEAANFIKSEQQKLGEGEKLRLTEVAEGERKRAEVLGAEAAERLAALDKVLAAAKEQPEIVKVPVVNVSGASAGGFEGAAAILGVSNLVNTLGAARANVPTPPMAPTN